MGILSAIWEIYIQNWRFLRISIDSIAYYMSVNLCRRHKYVCVVVSLILNPAFYFIKLYFWCLESFVIQGIELSFLKLDIKGWGRGGTVVDNLFEDKHRLCALKLIEDFILVYSWAFILPLSFSLSLTLSCSLHMLTFLPGYY